MTPATVAAVLLADGRPNVAAGSFTIGVPGSGDHDDRGVRGYRFEETAEAGPYGPAKLTGPLEALLTVRHVTPRGPRHQSQAVGRARTQSRDATVRQHSRTRELTNPDKRKADTV